MSQRDENPAKRPRCNSIVNHDPDPSINPKTSFFSLPAELRIQVYRLAFVHDVFEQYYHCHCATYYRTIKYLPIKSALLVSRQFHTEAKDVYYKESTILLSFHSTHIRRQGNAIHNIDIPMRGDLHLIQHAEVNTWLRANSPHHNKRNPCLSCGRISDNTSNSLELPSLKTLKIRMLAGFTSTRRLGLLAQNSINGNPYKGPRLRRASYKDHFEIRNMMLRQIGCLSRLGPDLQSLDVEIRTTAGPISRTFPVKEFESGVSLNHLARELGSPIRSMVKIKKELDRRWRGVPGVHVPFPNDSLPACTWHTLVHNMAKQIRSIDTYKSVLCMLKEQVQLVQNSHTDMCAEESRVKPSYPPVGVVPDLPCTESSFQIIILFREVWGSHKYQSCELPDNFTRRLKKRECGLTDECVERALIEGLWG